ncbi:hypothetical protein ZIOFF_026264 [Zingiber officinale]|uniref:Bulb-type lectin domain-containing protein n=1 Tax=Zingiber officinale TaxID=94328 RepID=A0A8J5GX64_ZINOF|nr:hypothetical protein ZIOFF_026264 [Zingiber officinale]
MAALVTLSAAAVLLGLLLPSAMANNNVLYRGDKLLVLKDNGNEVWSFQGNGRVCYAFFDTDGNFRIYNENGNMDNEFNTIPGSILVLQRDGHVVIYSTPVFIIPEDEPTNRKIAMVTKN